MVSDSTGTTGTTETTGTNATGPRVEAIPEGLVRLGARIDRWRTPTDPTTGVEPPRSSSPGWLRLIGPGIGVVVGLILVRGVLGGGLPEGDDAPYHVAKNLFAFSEIFGRGHLDGWAPTFSMGSEQFLLYGPGSALVASALRLFTFGTVDHPTLVAWVGALGYVATAPAAYFFARGLRLGRVGASVVGVASLCVSVPFGTGLAGTFDLGLIPHQLAVPLVLVTLGALVRVVESPDRRWVTLAAVAAMGVTVTHLTSALVALAAFAVMMLCRWAAPVRDRVRTPPSHGLFAAYRLALAGVLAAGFGAWWLLPLAENSGPRPSTATWRTPPFGEEVQRLLRTRLWASQVVVALTLAALAACAIWLIVGSEALSRLGRWRVAVVAAGPALLVLLYAMYHVLPGDTGLLMVNRGTGYAALLWILPIGVVADRLVARRSDRVAMALPAALGLIVVVMPALVPASGYAHRAVPPRPELQAAGRVLADSVPPEGRFAWVHERGFDTSFGPVHPELWLAMDSESATLNGFGGETISPVDTFLQYRLASIDPRQAEPLLIRDGVTHLVGRTSTLAAYAEQPGWRPVLVDGELTVLEHIDDVTLAAPLNDQRTELLAWSPERVRWRTEGAEELVTGLPAFPKWHLSIDGTAITANERGGFLTARLPDAGGHIVEATFRRSWADRLGVAITLVFLLARFGLPVVRRRRGTGPASAVSEADGLAADKDRAEKGGDDG